MVMKRRNFELSCYALVVVVAITSCTLLDTESPGNLVPPTADEDPALPQLEIEVAGRKRKIHLQTFGSPSNPPVFILHGGPGADFRLLLPLKALADTHYIVMWDSRGAGLSERIPRGELTLESFQEEILRVKQAICPAEKITLLGHSFGATMLARFTATHPELVEQLIMVEPGKLDNAQPQDPNGGAVSFTDGQNFFWQNEILSSSDHAVADYKAVDLLPRSGRNWTCDDSIIRDYPFWRFGTYHYHIVMKSMRKLSRRHNWADGIEKFQGRITIIAGTCGALSEAFQRQANLQAVPQATLITIAGAGHISLFTTYGQQTTEMVRQLLHP